MTYFLVTVVMFELHLRDILNSVISQGVVCVCEPLFVENLCSRNELHSLYTLYNAHFAYSLRINCTNHVLIFGKTCHIVCFF